MNHVTGTLTVFFEGPFWVGVFERAADGEYAVAQVVFGAEPRDEEVYALVLRRFHQLRFSPVQMLEAPVGRVKNPKRRQREARRATEAKGVGTKAQQALQAQREAMKMHTRMMQRQAHAADAERRYAKKQEKRKQKHRGH